MSRTATFPYASLTFTYVPGTFKPLAASPLGLALWSFLTRPHIVHALAVAVDVGAAPVSAISLDLLLEFGSGSTALRPLEQLAEGLETRFPVQAPINVDTVKQMIGHMIRQIVETLGYALHTKNSRANDRSGVFSTSARYK